MKAKAKRKPGRERSAGRKAVRRGQIVPDVAEKLKALEALFANTTDEEGRRVFKARCGVYAFFDFDGEPIYVGQSFEELQTRIRRHLTNQRTDAVAMHVLDPVEVAAIRAWPFWGGVFEPPSTKLTPEQKAERKATLNRAEYAVYIQLIEQSAIHAILNEKVPAEEAAIELPASYGGTIVPEAAVDRLYHRDERIARRAETIAILARVIKEREVQLGLRKTFLAQAKRLERLARQRLDELTGEMAPEQVKEETTAEGAATDADTMSDGA